jgi:hypothetical protein
MKLIISLLAAYVSATSLRETAQVQDLADIKKIEPVKAIHELPKPEEKDRKLDAVQDAKAIADKKWTAAVAEGLKETDQKKE